MAKSQQEHSALKRAKETEQLGMSPGKARNILVNKVLFEYCKALGKTTCHRCGTEVLSYSDLGLDHIKPWRNEPNAKELYFDVDNIAISHRGCNTTDRPGRKQLPDGMSWCASHRDFHPLEEFGSGKRWNGVDYSCLRAHLEKAERMKGVAPEFPCPQCGNDIRKKCQKCGYEMTMAEYMAMRRAEGAKY